MMASIDDALGDEFVVFQVGLLTGDLDRVVQLLYCLELIHYGVDVRALKSEGKALRDRYGQQLAHERL